MELSEAQKEKIEQVIACVCDYFGVDVFITTERHGEYQTCSNARHFCWYILHYDMGVSLRLIGNRFNRRKNTINKALAKIRFGIKHQSYYRDRYNDIVSKIEIPDLSSIK